MHVYVKFSAIVCSSGITGRKTLCVLLIFQKKIKIARDPSLLHLWHNLENNEKVLILLHCFHLRFKTSIWDFIMKMDSFR